MLYIYIYFHVIKFLYISGIRGVWEYLNNFFFMYVYRYIFFLQKNTAGSEFAVIHILVYSFYSISLPEWYSGEFWTTPKFA